MKSIGLRKGLISIGLGVMLSSIIITSSFANEVNKFTKVSHKCAVYGVYLQKNIKLTVDIISMYQKGYISALDGYKLTNASLKDLNKLNVYNSCNVRNPYDLKVIKSNIKVKQLLSKTKKAFISEM